MNSFMRSIGFKGYGLQDEDALIRRAISAGIKADKVFYNDRHGRAMIVYAVSPSAGVGIFGHMTGDKFIYDTHFPYLFTNRATKEKEIVIFKSLTSEYFSGITENVKGDIPRVFFVSNPVDVLFDIDSKSADTEYETEGDGALKHIVINDVNVAYSGLAIAASVILPAYDKKRFFREAENIYGKGALRQQAFDKTLDPGMISEPGAAGKKPDPTKETGEEAKGAGDAGFEQRKSSVMSNVKRAEKEDILSIVDTHIYPGGQVGEGYVVLGNIVGMREEENIITGQSFYIMSLQVNDETIEVAVNTADIIGEPKVGRRFNARMWMQGYVM